MLKVLLKGGDLNILSFKIITKKNIKATRKQN